MSASHANINTPRTAETGTLIPVVVEVAHKHKQQREERAGEGGVERGKNGVGESIRYFNIAHSLNNFYVLYVCRSL